jgi:hypothetical protein
MHYPQSQGAHHALDQFHDPFTYRRWSIAHCHQMIKIPPQASLDTR